MTKTGGSENVPIESLPTVIGKIAVAAGYQGMVGGQSADIEMQGKDVDADLVKYIHTHKTGALISVSVTSGAILGRGSEDQVKAIQAYGDGIGLAFQIADDILDIEGDSREMGKSSGSDEKKGKITYPSIFGLNKSKEILRDTVDSAIGSLEHFDSKADPLRLIASYIIERRK
jgi:geranylgeranyl diphosphate synthase type II